VIINQSIIFMRHRYTLSQCFICLSSFEQSVIDDAVDEWRKCLCAWNYV